LTASIGTSYLWSTGDTVRSIIISLGGIYNVAITDTSGCIAVSSDTISVNNICNALYIDESMACSQSLIPVGIFNYSMDSTEHILSMGLPSSTAVIELNTDTSIGNYGSIFISVANNAITEVYTLSDSDASVMIDLDSNYSFDHRE
jgi:hypothetical protein